LDNEGVGQGVALIKNEANYSNAQRVTEYPTNGTLLVTLPLVYYW